MLVAQTPLKIASTPQKPPAQAAAAAPAYKPLAEYWTVGSDTFASTEALVGGGQNLDGQTAVYHYTTQADKVPFSRGEKVANAIGAGLQIAVGGAVVGAMGGAALSVLAGIGDLMGGLMGGHMSGVSSAVMLVPIALGAAGGAIIGARQGYAETGQAQEGYISGVLGREANGHLAFYPGGQVTRKVDLNEYQNAGQAPTSTPQGTSNPTLSTLKGAAVGALVPAASFVPLVGLIAGGAAGATAGAAVDQRTELGKGVGLVLGVGATIGTFAAASAYGWQGLAGLSAGTAALGAVAGKAVFGTPAEPQADYGQQWWNQNTNQNQA